MVLSPSIAHARGATVLERMLDRFDGSVLDGAQRVSRIRLVITDGGTWDALVSPSGATLEQARTSVRPAAVIGADAATWERVADDLRGGMDAYREGRLVVRHNLHLGVSFLAATSGMTGPERLRFDCVSTSLGTISVCAAGLGEPVILLHGLGATKVSFLPTIAALAPTYRTIALDLPGFGDSTKPVLAPYHPPFFARAVCELMDELGIERAHFVGNSMGGRIALEIGLRHPERACSLSLLAPSLAWRRPRPWAPLVRVLRPELGLVQLSPRWAIEAVVHQIVPRAAASWLHAGVDEFLRSYTTARGRVAFYAAARQIYLEEPHGARGFWTRLESLATPALFVWGKLDRLVPFGFAAHVRRALPSSRHLELDCGHVPQLERPQETHGAIAAFLAEHRAV
ncbi:MAG TPA: alpha/beta fold hydrolase [Candidatus Binatia bacterium]